MPAVSGEIDAGKDRRRKQPAADLAARQRLQHRPRSKDQHAQAQHRRNLLRRSIGGTADDQRIDQKNSDDADMLQRADHRDGRRRQFLGPVDELRRLFHRATEINLELPQTQVRHAGVCTRETRRRSLRKTEFAVPVRVAATRL